MINLRQILVLYLTGYFMLLVGLQRLGAYFYLPIFEDGTHIIGKDGGGGVFLGVGGFQLYDGIIQHKLMRIHQIRYVDNLPVYDLIWNIVAIIIIIVGIFLIVRSKK